MTVETRSVCTYFFFYKRLTNLLTSGLLLGATMFTSLIALVLSLLLLGGCVGTTSGLSIATTTTNGASEQIPATLLKPDGPGPFPAIVMMHDCSGLGARSSGAPIRWGRELVGL